MALDQRASAWTGPRLVDFVVCLARSGHYLLRGRRVGQQYIRWTDQCSSEYHQRPQAQYRERNLNSPQRLSRQRHLWLLPGTPVESWREELDAESTRTSDGVRYRPMANRLHWRRHLRWVAAVLFREQHDDQQPVVRFLR